VVIPLATQHYMLLERNLIYTGFTRGKRSLVGSIRRAPAQSGRSASHRPANA
jgi:ATP-dependent exoDNAse (exonuclease V) alpha subunit